MPIGMPNNVSRLTYATLMLQSLGVTPAVQYSQYTGKWYGTMNIDIGDGHMRSGVAEHRATPEEAVIAFFDRLIDECYHMSPFVLTGDKRVLVGFEPDRRAYAWNGVAFHRVQENHTR